jgi:hypothetical protein
MTNSQNFEESQRILRIDKKFVKNYGQTTTPLMTLLKKDTFSWTQEVTQYFEKIKEVMCGTLVPATLVFTKTFIAEYKALGTRHWCSLLKLLRQLRGGGGVNQLLLCLNNIKSIKPFLIFHQVTINIIHHMNTINNEHQSHIRYTQRQIFTRKPIKGENLFFFEMIGSLLSSVHHLCLSTNSK